MLNLRCHFEDFLVLLQHIAEIISQFFLKKGWITLNHRHQYAGLQNKNIYLSSSLIFKLYLINSDLWIQFTFNCIECKTKHQLHRLSLGVDAIYRETAPKA